MKFKKSLLCLAMASTLIFGATAMAAEDNTVTFDGKAITENVDIDVFRGMLPGDEQTVTVKLANTSTVDTDWYMENKLATLLEGGTGALSYELTYNGTSKFSNSLVLDSQVSEAGKTMEDYFFLGTVKPGETAEVTLTLGLDGETQDNAYQEQTGNLSMKFATTFGEGKVTTNKITNTVKTGDTAKTQLYMIMIAVAGVVLLGLGVLSLVKDRKEEN